MEFTISLLLYKFIISSFFNKLFLNMEESTKIQKSKIKRAPHKYWSVA